MTTVVTKQIVASVVTSVAIAARPIYPIGVNEYWPTPTHK